MKVKGRGDFVVYLSDAAVSFLRSLGCVKKEDLIFPTIHGSALSDMAMNMQIRRLNSEAASRGEEVLRDEEQSKLVGKDVAITQHGTSRASFKTWTKSEGTPSDLTLMQSNCVWHTRLTIASTVHTTGRRWRGREGR